ncbi:Ubiquitin carboxyl-terminal hydrolase 12 [Camellia lanceoleosa]|uniref:Ubiquitin carboxyl-terminal hydrolase 12 n=1 Tax=Camellia lanceoleosa TaxID=1840588 RepID=A0ACC0FPK9_9ERIC|nr:Ubiquitin carboxyl-terminal hydrolase 12 [Camellia lanceoleosa]
MNLTISQFSLHWASGQSEQVMEKKPCNHGLAEVSRSVRDLRPAHYLFKIESFSILLEEKIEKYESDDFQAGGYEWELCLYPNGNKKGNGKDHISLYLVIKDTDNLPHGWEVNVQFKLFVFDHIRDKYLTIQEGKIRRFHRMKTEWGFAQLLSLDTFNDTSNGYLLEDSCIFGAEVFVIEYAGKGECMSMIKVPKNNTFTWKVDNFSTITDIFLCSDEFKVGEQKWKLELYPRGNAKPEGESLSLFLAVADYAALPLNWKVYAKFKLRIKDQINGSHIVKKTQCWFRASTRNWGFSSFEKLCNINDRGSSFIMKDTLIVEVEIMVMSAVKNFP